MLLNTPPTRPVGSSSPPHPVRYSYGKQLLAPGQRIGYLAISPRVPDPAPVREAVRLAQFVNSYAWPTALMQRVLPDVADLCIDLRALERRQDTARG